VMVAEGGFPASWRTTREPPAAGLIRPGCAPPTRRPGRPRRCRPPWRAGSRRRTSGRPRHGRDGPAP